MIEQYNEINAENDSETTVVLEDIRLLDGTKELGKQIEMMKPLTIHFRFRKSKSVNPVAFTVGFIRDDGLHCCSVFSDEFDWMAQPEVKEGYVEVTFPKVLLLPANYRLFISAMSPGPGFRLVHASEYFPVQVIGSDHFHSQHGKLYLPADWRIK